MINPHTRYLPEAVVKRKRIHDEYNNRPDKHVRAVVIQKIEFGEAKWNSET